MPLPGLLDHSQGRTGCGAIAFKPAFCKLEQKGLGSRDKTLGSVFADRHHLAEYGLIGCFAMTTPRTAGRIAALALCKARRPWRLAITDAIIFGIVRRSAPKSHSLVPPRPTQTIRIARATSYMIGGQAMAAAPAAEGRLNRPRPKQEVRPIFAPARAIGVVRRDPKKEESRICIVGID